MAQDVKPNSNFVGGLEEVVVTGNKRAEDLSKVPEAISVVDSKELESAGITSLEGLNLVVPSFLQLPAQDPGTNFISVRGITQVRLAEPPVAIVIDGVQAASPDAAMQDLYNISQIEVLKGPQGSIYGRNAIGGAINIVTKTPTNTFENEASVEGGQGSFFRAFGASSGPLISDKLFYTVSGVYKSSAGQIFDPSAGRNVDGYD